MLLAGKWSHLKQRLKASLKEAGGSDVLVARLDAVDGSLHARLDAVERDLDRRLLDIEQKISTVQYFSHGSRATYVGNNRVLVKIVVGGANIAYFVEADDRLISPWFIVTGGYETDLTSYFLRELKPDSHCIDVGSNFGYFTCLLARFCPNGRVIGIEADQHVFEIARDNVHINGFGGHANIVHAAATDSEGEVTLHRRVTRSGCTSITKVWESYTQILGEPSPERFTVKGVRIDDLAGQMSGRVDFMKIDVEGAEPLVFEGARDTIAANPQLSIVMEWSPGQIRDAGFDIPTFLGVLDGMGLRPYEIQHDKVAPLSFDEVSNSPYRAGIVLKRGA
ncbi:MAG: FkbM family methyltransferase [Caulobacteraceae bacterium]|nr:FkbM family methyltransferase [Caulobacteraceae bacterium]